MAARRRTPPPPVPYAVVAQVAFGVHLRTLRVPEAWIPRLVAHGWIVVARDTDIVPRPERAGDADADDAAEGSS